jgi:ankyrin repeat protein
VSSILDAGADPGPLLVPAARRCAEVVALALVERGADVNAVDERGDSPLALSARCPGDLMVRLLAKGAKPSGTMVLYALTGARLEPMELQARLARLKAVGADLNVRDSRGMTPLAAAAGPYSTDDGGLECSDEERAAVVGAFLAAGADPRIADREGGTPLLRALRPTSERCAPDTSVRPRAKESCAAHRATLELLIGAGADPLAGDRRGNTPLRLAAGRACLPCLEVLKAHGVDLDTPGKGDATLLHEIAAGTFSQSHPEAAAAALVQAGARLDRRDAKGRTPYDLLFSRGKPELLDRLGHLLAPPGRPLAQAVARVTASSTLEERGRAKDFYAPARGIDGSLATCWCKGVKGHGDGEWLQIELKAPARLRTIRIYPGCGADDSTYYANNRIQQLDVTVDGTALPASPLPGRRFHDLGISTTAPISTLRFTVRRAGGDQDHPPPKYDDTCIGEIQADLE